MTLIGSKNFLGSAADIIKKEFAKLLNECAIRFESNKMGKVIVKFLWKIYLGQLF